MKSSLLSFGFGNSSSCLFPLLNPLAMSLLAFVAYFFYAVIFKNPLGDPLLYVLAVLLGSVSFATVFTMIAGISSKAGNNSTLMAILGFR